MPGIRRRPDYDPDDLRKGIEHLDVNINRLQQTIDNLNQRNESMKQSIAKNNEDVRIFNAEIGKLENEKVEIRKLIAEIERERKVAGFHV